MLSLGFLFHSVAVCCILYGVALMQCWSYFRKFKRRDGWAIQALIKATRPLLVSFKIGQRDLIIELIFSGFVAFLVQHQQKLLLGWIRVTLYYFVGVVLSQYTLLAELAIQDDISIVTNVLGLLADVSISFFMIFLLQRSKTGFKRSTDMLNRLIIFSVNTGLPTSLTSILTVVLLEAAPGTFIYIFIYLLLCHFYTNCLLITLNGRDAIRSASQPTSTDQYAMSIPLEISGRTTTNQNLSTQEPIAIRIQQTTQNFQSDDAKDSQSYGREHDVEAK
ncbi:hypothetical protein K435DRAFT_843799 [Dendrothele bispora CBS 962.96]|uniref:DUF6534 domain-containing protein n=1 Tax=Dendrothele bispora (strain CBS 962.96) TaxID=1314807 RepID=A0A4S8L684_DENBC|nr:hypothetical protein K435DRAFT_843799 [Dendrothele bispora CBS 962.96]